MGYKAGQRVIDKYLGNGTIQEVVQGIGAVILFDKTPPIEYNMGKNPALALDYNIKLAEKGSTMDIAQHRQDLAEFIFGSCKCGNNGGGDCDACVQASAPDFWQQIMPWRLGITTAATAGWPLKEHDIECCGCIDIYTDLTETELLLICNECGYLIAGGSRDVHNHDIVT